MCCESAIQRIRTSSGFSAARYNTRDFFGLTTRKRNAKRHAGGQAKRYGGFARACGTCERVQEGFLQKPVDEIVRRYKASDKLAAQ